MEQVWLHGKLEEKHFSQLLHHIWKAEGSGRLEVTKDSAEKRVTFHRGQLVITLDHLDEEAFCLSLQKKKILDSPSIKRCQQHVKSQKVSFIKALIELALLKPNDLWVCTCLCSFRYPCRLKS